MEWTKFTPQQVAKMQRVEAAAFPAFAEILAKRRPLNGKVQGYETDLNGITTVPSLQWKDKDGTRKAIEAVSMVDDTMTLMANAFYATHTDNGDGTETLTTYDLQDEKGNLPVSQQEALVAGEQLYDFLKPLTVGDLKHKFTHTRRISPPLQP